MDKEYIRNMYLETLTEKEQRLVSLFSVICSEGLSLEVAFNVLKPDNPKEFNTSVDKLCACNWLFNDYHTISCDPQVAKAVLEITSLDFSTIEEVLSGIRNNIVLHPLDDMLKRQEYFVVARLFLKYLMGIWNKLTIPITLFMPLFSEVVIAFVTNFELSLCGNKRQPIYNLEDRLDFKLLTLLIAKGCSDYEGIANRLLGELYANIFRYDEAKVCFRKADAILGKDAGLLMAKAKMYENLGITSRAFQLVYRAYLTNKENGTDDENINVCLYISYLCAVSESPTNCKYWRNIARSLIGNKTVPFGHIFNITMKEIEALIHLDDTALAHQIIDSAELEVYNLYGGSAPELARLSYIRSLIDGEVGQLRKSNEHYRRYVQTNHSNYGYSVGDIVVLYSAIISDNILRGNNNTANIFAIKMQDLYAEGSNIAPGVRLSQAFANCASNLADEIYNLGDAYLEMAKKIFEDELKPDDELLEEIAPIFHNGIIPESVLMTEEYRIINIITINICLGEGRFSDAKELIDKMKKEESDDLERLKWNVHLGRTLIKEGKLDDGLEVWKDTINKVDKTHKFKFTKEIAEWARTYNLLYDSMDFYEEALQADTMVYGKTCDIAEVLQSYADVLELCGLKGKSDAPWRQALMLVQSLGDKDGVSLLYFSWGLAKQDYEAECLLKKAIQNWEPEHYIFDETLSKMFYFLCCAQAMQGKTEDARFSAHKAVDLFPTDFPLHLLEDIEDYL